MADSFSRNELFGIAAHTQDSQLDEEQLQPQVGGGEVGGTNVTASPEAVAEGADAIVSLAQPNMSHSSSPNASPA